MKDHGVFIAQFDGNNELQAVIEVAKHFESLLKINPTMDSTYSEQFVKIETSKKKVPNPNATTRNTTTMYEITHYVFEYPRNKDGSPNKRFKINQGRN